MLFNTYIKDLKAEIREQIEEIVIEKEKS